MIWALFILFVAIQIADVATTAAGLKRGGEEANFLPAALFQRIGFWPACIGIKAIGIALALGVTLFVRDPWIFTGLLDLGGVYVLWNNARVLKSLP